MSFPEISSELVGSFANHLASYLPAKISGATDFLAGVRHELGALQKLSGSESCQVRREKLGISLSDSFLRERALFEEDGKFVLAGARFQNGNRDFPFVALSSNFNLDDAFLEKLAPMVVAEFGELRPKGFTWDQKPGQSGQFSVWSHVVMGEGLPRECPPLPENLRLSWPSRFEHFSEYYSQYLAHLDRLPGLKGFVRIEPEQDLQEAAKKGLLCVVENERGHFLGVYGGLRKKLYGREGLYIFESMLCSPIQGKGYGPTLQRAFLSALSSKFSFVWGNIHDHNLPSLKTAQSVGRKPIQTEYFRSLSP